MLVGCIADDLTGATDLAGGLVREGARTMLAIGVPGRTDVVEADAVVIALKSRSIPAPEAIELSLDASHWLVDRGAERIYFKYASTFDSTPAGNIGPVTEALQAALDVDLTVACPAFPANGRTVHDGHLFVGSDLLADSPMRTHPTNPMLDSDLVRVLRAQTSGEVGLVGRRVIAAGAPAIRVALDDLATAGFRHAIVDATDDQDVAAIAAAVADDRLVTGGSALGAAIVAELIGRRTGSIPTRPDPGASPPSPTRASHGVVIAGSCSPATLAQIDAFAARHPVRRIDPRTDIGDANLPEAISRWASGRLREGPVLIASSAGPADVAAIVDQVGPGVGAAIEDTLGRVTARLVDDGVDRIVVAGGETSGAVVAALGLRLLEVGAEIEPGVPSVRADGSRDLRLVLKSGNFGSAGFFEIALAAIS